MYKGFSANGKGRGSHKLQSCWDSAVWEFFLKVVSPTCSLSFSQTLTSRVLGLRVLWQLFQKAVLTPQQ